MTPWNPADMSLREARDEMRRLRQNRCPSTADLRRENDVAQRIRELEAVELRCRPLIDPTKVAAMRAQLAALGGRS